MFNIKLNFCLDQKGTFCVKPRHTIHRVLKLVDWFCCKRRQEKGKESEEWEGKVSP